MNPYDGMKLSGSYNYGKSDSRTRDLSYDLLNGYNVETMPSTNTASNSMSSGYSALQDINGLTKSSQVPNGDSAKMFGMGKAISGLGDWATMPTGDFIKQPTLHNTFDYGTPAETLGRRQVQQFLMQQMSQLQPTMKYPSFGGR